MAGIINPGLEMTDDLSSGVADVNEALPKFVEHDVNTMKEDKIKRSTEQLDTEIISSKTLCGWFKFRPKYLQKFRTAKWALFWLCWAGAMQGMVVNGFINVVITTIEKRFGLNSSETGLIAGGYDIASFVFLIPVSYLGGRSKASKPKYIGVGVLVLGIGSLLFASPHYLARANQQGGQRSSLSCHRGTSTNTTSFTNTNETSLSPKCDEQLDDTVDVGPFSGFYLMIFFIAQLLHGAGAAPFYTLGVTYLDENVSKKMSSVYLGIYYTMAVIGPALGYVIGGELLKLYTDFLTTDPGTIGMTPDSNVWIGAWWIGFVAATIVCIIVAIPIIAFPASLPGAEELAKEKVSEAHEKSPSAGGTSTEAFSRIRELPRALTELLGNPAFFMLNLAGASEGLLIAGFAAFLPKLIENQFSVTASSAALLMGLVTVPAGGGGTFLGGYLIKRWNLPCSGILKFCIFSTAACIIFTLCFGLGCPNLDFAGLTVPYSDSDQKVLALDDKCNSGCGCTTNKFSPICGVNGVTYYSPCYAGCDREIQTGDVKVYQNCSCISSQSNWTTASGDTILYEAVNTTCTSGCKYLWLFICLAFCNMLMTFLCTMPALAATLRVVRDEQRSFALGVQWIKVRILGTIPAPMIFGALIDDTCILWHETCEGQGACLVYDNYWMSWYMLALAFIGKTASLLFFFLAWWCYVPPGSRKIIPEPGQPIATILPSDGPNSHNSEN
ncbi:solute carrier organic anion transporter family member 4A1 isoform X1 [Microplitis demolitor]|uniref:solute carrier organic anion transporter family member 4A1 isoform X1 n=1 Tax=Microplitis demolitor TaxID=69319 RepID=UPI0004CD145A|nr:solute carrier organic anion transporter family member 4A1 isoform X1 [Microplitis demolitor]XP_008554727.1 solute carrier organic anion transporter family member 4A1 isoform X1 [Microplitis demolitor]